MKLGKTKSIGALALALLSCFAAPAGAAQWGASLKTPGFEDIVIMDVATYMMSVGGEDSLAAYSVNLAAIAAQESTDPRNGNRTIPTLTQRVFADHLPPPVAALGMEKKTLRASELQNLVIARKQDVIDGKRFLFSMRLKAMSDGSMGLNGDTLFKRDSLSRYVVRFETDAKYYAKTDGEVSFHHCVFIDGFTYGDTWKSPRPGRSSASEFCMAIPTMSGMNIPTGIFVSDLSKFGDLATGFSEKSTLRVGLIVAPDGRSGTFRGYTGRNFTSSALILYDAATMKVIAGPIPLDEKSPDLLYATNNCKKTVPNGLNPLLDPAGDCATLNPSISPLERFEVQY